MGTALATRFGLAFVRHAIDVILSGMIELVAIRGRYADEVVTREAREGAEH